MKDGKREAGVGETSPTKKGLSIEEIGDALMEYYVEVAERDIIIDDVTLVMKKAGKGYVTYTITIPQNWAKLINLDEIYKKKQEISDKDIEVRVRAVFDPHKKALLVKLDRVKFVKKGKKGSKESQ